MTVNLRLKPTIVLLLLLTSTSWCFAAINNLDSAATLPENFYSNTPSQVRPNSQAPQAASSAMPSSPLAQLPPLHKPAAIDWWPLAPGWWLVGFIAIAGSIGALLIGYQFYAARSLKRASSKELQQLYVNYQQDRSSGEYLLRSNQLLRRFCMQQFKFTNVAAIHGEAWLKHLDTLANKCLFQSDCGRQLLALYQPPEQQVVDIDTLHPLILNWLTAVNPSQSIARQLLTKASKLDSPPVAGIQP